MANSESLIPFNWSCRPGLSGEFISEVRRKFNRRIIKASCDRYITPNQASIQKFAAIFPSEVPLQKIGLISFQNPTGKGLEEDLNRAFFSDTARIQVQKQEFRHARP